MSKTRLNNKGDTLVEVIIALSILTAVLISAFTLTNRSFRVGQQAKERTRATELLQAQAESLRAYRSEVEKHPLKDFGDLCDDITFAAGINGPFILDRNATGEWDAQPVADRSPQNPNRGIYKVYLDLVPTETNCISSPLFGALGPREVTVDIHVEWVRIGTDGSSSSEVETTELRSNIKENPS